MKKILFALAAFAFIVSSCNEKVNDPEQAYAEFSIGISEADFVTLKSAPLSDDFIPECDEELSLDYAHVWFEKDGVPDDVVIPIFVVNGKYVTQPIKIILGEGVNSVDIEITDFTVWHEVEGGDDIMVKATPHIDSEYYQFINPNNGLRTITLGKFTKEEIIIDVLCYDDLVYDNFGFIWFNIQPITVRQMCFFGDICVCEPESYRLPYGDVFPYVDQVNGGTIYDLIAYMKIIVSSSENDWSAEFDNLDNANDCLPIYWPDYDLLDDEITIELKVLLPVGDVLDWVSIKTWVFDSYEDIPVAGADNVLDFVIGGCHFDADYVFPAHLHLPTDLVSMTPTFLNHSASGEYRYFNINLAGIGDGYSITNGNYLGWCGDLENYITSGNTYTGVRIYSSLNWDESIGGHLTQEKLNQLNFIINELPGMLADYNEDHSIGTAHAGKVVQALVWKILNPGVPLVSGYESQEAEAQSFADYAVANTPPNYVPEVGDMIAIIFHEDNSIQVLFTPMASPCIEVFE
ncbi:hypothetical protein KEM09_15645 [Carboxylicivirga mesophila]|uniref:Uncharacterized protein n=1 Tax=Carboxylicivirga mesophila TaxID=1166478 RepID=A0ABS5KEA3_9BACT|nr:hypothetical protein [Carboxylicivirga mesophila]MBS2212851.1 hypothetical protein [Carboxylicivirga mesophila]